MRPCTRCYHVYYIFIQKLTPLLGSECVSGREAANARRTNTSRRSGVRDGTCQEEVGHERRDNKRESGRGGGRRGAIERLEKPNQKRRGWKQVAAAESTRTESDVEDDEAGTRTDG